MLYLCQKICHCLHSHKILSIKNLIRNNTSHNAIFQVLTTRDTRPSASTKHVYMDLCLQRSLLRTVLMKGFHLLVWTLCVRSVRDTQCGFKLFTRRSAALLFPNLHVQRWCGFRLCPFLRLYRVTVPYSKILYKYTPTLYVVHNEPGVGG